MWVSGSVGTQIPLVSLLNGSEPVVRRFLDRKSCYFPVRFRIWKFWIESGSSETDPLYLRSCLANVVPTVHFRPPDSSDPASDIEAGCGTIRNGSNDPKRKGSSRIR